LGGLGVAFGREGVCSFEFWINKRRARQRMREDQITRRLRFPRDYLAQRLIQEFVAKIAGDLVERQLGRFRPKADLYDPFAFILEMQITPIREPIGYPQQC